MGARNTLTLAGMAFLLGGSVGHTFRPQKMARRYGWTASPRYQRQLASFELPHLYGMALLLGGRGRITDGVYIRIVSLSSLLLGLHHLLAIREGDTAGRQNAIVAGASTLLGLAGLLVARADARREPSVR
jgi:hypothetical protein